MIALVVFSIQYGDPFSGSATPGYDAFSPYTPKTPHHHPSGSRTPVVSSSSSSSFGSDDMDDESQPQILRTPMPSTPSSVRLIFVFLFCFYFHFHNDLPRIFQNGFVFPGSWCSAGTRCLSQSIPTRCGDSVPPSYGSHSRSAR